MIFYSNGEALELAGPSGSLLAFAIVALVAVCVMECVSELIQMFPTPNAIVEVLIVYSPAVTLSRVVDLEVLAIKRWLTATPSSYEPLWTKISPGWLV